MPGRLLDDPALDRNFMGDPEPGLPSQAAPPVPDPQKPQEGQMPRGKVAPGPSGNRLEQEEREGRGQGALAVACTPHYADEKRCTGPQILPPGMCLAPPTTPYSLQGPRASGHQGFPAFLIHSVRSQPPAAGGPQQTGDSQDGSSPPPPNPKKLHQKYLKSWKGMQLFKVGGIY